MSNFRVLYVDDSSQSTVNILLTVDGSAVVIPRKGDGVTINDETFIVEFIVHSFLKGSPTQVIEVHVINGFEFSMRD